MSDNRSFPKSMQAVFIEKHGGQLVVKGSYVPNPGPNDVLIKIAAAPVNPSDISAIRNAAADKDLTTYIPGLEGSGTVVAAGKRLLPRLWLGKRVACTTGYSTSGSWAEYMVTPAAMCFPLNRNVTDEQGCMSLVNPLTALAFFEIIKQHRHKSLINNPAASSLGRMIELLGAKHKIPVINIVRNQKQAAMLTKMGSPHVLDSSGPSFFNDLGALSEKLEATVLFDSVCSSELKKIIDVLPQNSSVIIYGNLSGEEEIAIDPKSLISNNINISGFYLGRTAKENGLIKNMANIMKVSQLMSTDLKIKIRNRYPLSRAQEAVDTYLNNMSSGKVILVPELDLSPERKE